MVQQKNIQQSRVNIYKEHSDIANKLLGGEDHRVNSNNIFAAAGAGVFRYLVNSYLLAASVGLALQESTPKDKMPPKKDIKHDIREEIVMSYGGKNLAVCVGLISHLEQSQPSLDPHDSIKEQLNELANTNAETAWGSRFEILDQYAHRGFNWLIEHNQEHASIEQLVSQALALQPKSFEQTQDDVPNNPLAGIL